jgi:transposase
MVNTGLTRAPPPIVVRGSCCWPDGVSNTEISKRVGVSRPTVIDWRARYERSGMIGLDDEPRSGRPRQVDQDAMSSQALRAACGRP